MERAEDVVFKKGPQSTMNDIPREVGSLLVATDTGNVFLDTDKEIDIPDSKLTNTETVRIQLKDDTKLPLTGGSIEGNLSITGNVEVHSSGNQSYLSIDTSNQTTLVLYDAAGNIGTEIIANNLVLSDTTKANWRTALGIVEGFTEEQADLKYLQLTGGTITGNLTLGGNNITINTAGQLNLNSNILSQWQSELGIQTQTTADSRYLRLTGGTVSGSTTFSSNLNVAGTAVFDGTNGIQIGNIKIIYNPDEDGLQFIKATS